MQLLEIFRNLRKRYLVYQTRIKLKKYGLKALQIFDELARKEGWEYSLGYGTLLGAIREKDFIKNDDDIDILVRREYLTSDLIQKVKSAGFEIKGLFLSSDHELAHYALKYHNLTFDLYGYNINYKGGDSIVFSPFPVPDHSWEDSLNMNLFQICRVHFDYHGVKEITFKGIKCTAFANAEDFLAAVYGDDWRIPIKNNKGVTQPSKEYVPMTELTASIVDIDSLA